MYLLKYVLKRIALMLLTMFIITTMCFVFVKLLPNMPVEQFGKDMQFILKRREMLGYDRPLMEQYVYYIFGRTGYTYDKLDANGNKVQDKDNNGNLLWQMYEVTDEHGNPVYVTDANGNYLDRDGNITYNKDYFVVKTDYVLDENGEKIQGFATDTVYVISKVHVGMSYTK